MPQSKHVEEIFEKLKPQLESAAQLVEATLPTPYSECIDDVNYIYIPRWCKGTYRFNYMIDGIWTYDDMVRCEPEERVEVNFNSPLYPQYNKYFCDAFREHYKDDKEIKIIAISPLRDGIIVRIPVRRVNELLNTKIVVPDISISSHDEKMTPSGLNRIRDSKSQRQKKLDFMKILLKPWYEKLRDKDVSKPLFELTYDDLFEPTEYKDQIEYLEFLQMLRNGSIVDPETYNGISARSVILKFLYK